MVELALGVRSADSSTSSSHDLLLHGLLTCSRLQIIVADVIRPVDGHVDECFIFVLLDLSSMSLICRSV